MIPKILTGVALAFAVIGLILKLVAISVPHFVDVHFIADIDDIDDDNIIAGVGVYQSVYDPTGENIIQDVTDEGLPTDIIESNTLEFVLLFPAQENFQAQLLPVGLDQAATLDDELNSGEEVQDRIRDAVELVESVEFSNCEDYRDEAIAAAAVYFNVLEDDILPLAVSAITVQIAGLLNDGPNGDDGLSANQANIILAASAAAEVGANLINGALATAAAVNPVPCASFIVDGAIDFASPLDDDLRGCINAGSGAIAGGLGPLTQVLLGHFDGVMTNPAFSLDGTPLSNVLLGAQGSVAFNDDEDNNGGGALNAVPDFVIEFPGVEVCAVGGGVFACETKQEYLGLLIQLLQENFDENVEGDAGNDLLGAAIAGLQGYLFIVGSPLVNENDTFLDFEQQGFVEDDCRFPATFESAYIPCEILEVFNFLQPGVILRNESCTDFRTFLPNIALLLEINENPLADTVRTIVETYQICDATGAGFDLGFSPIPDVCAELFSPGILISLYGIESQEQEEILADIVTECELDEEDNAAVATAQALVGLSVALNILTVIVIIVSFFVLPKILGPVGAVFSVLGAIFIISGLLVVRGAPVYEGVGEEPDGELEPIFVEGYVALLALVDAILFFLAGILLIASAITSCFCVSEDLGEYEDEKKIESAGDVEDKL